MADSRVCHATDRTSLLLTVTRLCAGSVTMGTVSRSAITILLAATMGAGCLSGDDTDPGWAAFRDAAAREVDGHTIYVVEWDRAVTLDELRAYYDRTKPVDGTIEQDSTVNTVGSADDVWSTDAA